MTETRAARIFHLLSSSAWESQAGTDGPMACDQFERNGFVHCCTREQIVEIASWWLTGDDALIALELETAAAGDVRFERADLGREYPHVYNPLPRAALVAAHELPGEGEAITLPERLRDPPPEFRVEGLDGGRAVEVCWRAGAFVAGDEATIERALAKVAAGEDVLQFPGVSRPASAETPYNAFCLLAASLDQITAYHGDPFAGAVP